MPNKWVEFVKQWATKNNIDYKSSISNPKCKEEYKKMKPNKQIKKEMKGGDIRPNQPQQIQPDQLLNQPVATQINLDIDNAEDVQEEYQQIIDDIDIILETINNFGGETNNISIVNQNINGTIQQVNNFMQNPIVQQHFPFLFNDVQHRLNYLLYMYHQRFNNQQQGIQGTGIIQDIEKGAKQIGTKIKDYGEAIIYGRNDYPPKVRDIIKKYGNIPILKMYACRTPVNTLLASALNIVSFGEFKKRFDKIPYDKLFHLDLRMELNTQPQTTLLIEKNEVISLTVNPKPPGKETECEFIPNNKSITLNQLLDGGKRILGNKFFNYSANNNNCQDFIIALLKGSRIGTQGNYDFIKQDTKALFKNLPGLRKIANIVTDIGGVFDTIIQGSGMEEDEELTQGYIKGKGGGASTAIQLETQDLNIEQLNNYLPQLMTLRNQKINDIAIGMAAINNLNTEPTEEQLFNYVGRYEQELETIENEIDVVINIMNLFTSTQTPPVSDEEDEEDEVGAGIKLKPSYYLQSIAFDKKKFSPKEAKNWIKSHKYKLPKTDITDTQIRFRQVAPAYIKKKGYNNFIIKQISNGIQFIIAYP